MRNEDDPVCRYESNPGAADFRAARRAWVSGLGQGARTAPLSLPHAEITTGLPGRVRVRCTYRAIAMGVGAMDHQQRLGSVSGGHARIRSAVKVLLGGMAGERLSFESAPRMAK